MSSNIETMLNSSLDDLKKSSMKPKLFNKAAKKRSKVKKGNNANKNNKFGYKSNTKKFGSAKGLGNRVLNMDLDTRPKTKKNLRQRIINVKDNRNIAIKTILIKKNKNPDSKKPKKKTPLKPTFNDYELSEIKIIANLNQIPAPLLAQKDMYVPLPESGSIPVPNAIKGTLNDKFMR